ncbi:MAG: hypothetical protein MUF61_02425 [archaeon]|jgi:hypothetical protein|nr:hypothetical protein [archaeon]
MDKYLLWDNIRRNTPVNADMAEDLRCLAAKCVYGSQEDSLEAYAELDGRLQRLNLHVPSLFERFGEMGKKANARVLARKIRQFDNAVNNAYKNAGKKGLMGLFSKTDDYEEQAD